MESEGSLPQLQEPATCRYPEPDQSSPWPPSQLQDVLVIFMQLRSIKMCLCGTSRFDNAAHVDSNRQSQPFNIKKGL
jgi:hypothetical protein